MGKESLPSWAHQDSDEGLVHVNVGGLKRSLCSSTLKKFPDTRLGKLLACDSEEAILQVCDDYDVQEKEFYFDRNPGLFPYVIHFYQTGKLHIMEELCVFSFSQEIEYWGINEFFLDSCCSYRYHDRKLESSRHRSWDDESDASSVDTSVDEISDLNKDMQHFQEVRYGNIRKCLWLTLENPGYSIPSKLFSLLSIAVVLTSISTMCINSMPEYQTFDSDGKLIEEPTMQALEVFCSCWFTFEVFRLMRIFRVLKLARHSTGLRSLGDVGLDTIPACWWWGTVSMTTVGYGDVVPVTVVGKLAASGCILGGTLVVALPITIIFNKFSHFYRRQKALEASVRNNNRKKMRMSCENVPEEDEEDEGSDGDSCCLDDDDIDDIEEDNIDYEDEGGVINYSYVEHPSYTSITRKKEPHQLC
ncbi:potassium voltage-gated channel subfamily S member 2 [Neolamprologus brichardi]|uniref:potassium voltage-gated channel subfamily S member 2 n=1 Tax=Neolamprologus brichardi TaxID=32507 RepID=UPI0016436F23|nr:potassium voltage-gated channel subfamily S member 2 [Neolamprologus brichardi]